jgi:selenocysteine lyase/cysteine desulfurase
LTLPAVEIGLRHITSIGIDTIANRVACLTGWMLDEITELRHDNGARLAYVHGPIDTTERGGTISLNLFDPTGRPLSSSQVEQDAAAQQISLRTGCFCNPGCGETAHALSYDMMRLAIQSAISGMSFQEMNQVMQEQFAVTINAIRISVGLASNFADAERAISFLAGYRNRAAAEVGDTTLEPSSVYVRDAA